MGVRAESTMPFKLLEKVQTTFSASSSIPNPLANKLQSENIIYINVNLKIPLQAYGRQHNT